MFHYNDPDKSKERASTKPLTLAQEYNVVALLNHQFTAGFKGNISKANLKLIQRFLNNYQNLSYHRDTTVGLWATDRKELATHKDFFQIK